MCDCVSKVNDNLKEGGFNARLALGFILEGPKKGVYPVLMTEPLEKRRGAGKAPTMFPSYCPFCGAAYERAQEATPA